MPTVLRRVWGSDEPHLGHRADGVTVDQLIEQSDIDQPERGFEPYGDLCRLSSNVELDITRLQLLPTPLLRCGKSTADYG
jgi:hypothetical protein